MDRDVKEGHLGVQIDYQGTTAAPRPVEGGAEVRDGGKEDGSGAVAGLVGSAWSTSQRASAGLRVRR